MAELLRLPGFEAFAAAPKKEGDPDGLRGFQREAVRNGLRDLKTVRGALFVLFPGAGKTRTASALIREWLGL